MLKPDNIIHFGPVVVCKYFVFDDEQLAKFIEQRQHLQTLKNLDQAFVTHVESESDQPESETEP
ncbi:MAG: hypothetical protein AAGG02_14275 [Cyanobacteria bacterium P01_H01_bin.15]